MTIDQASKNHNLTHDQFDELMLLLGELEELFRRGASDEIQRYVGLRKIREGGKDCQFVQKAGVLFLTGKFKQVLDLIEKIGNDYERKRRGERACKA